MQGNPNSDIAMNSERSFPCKINAYIIIDL